MYTSPALQSMVIEAIFIFVAGQKPQKKNFLSWSRLSNGSPSRTVLDVEKTIGTPKNASNIVAHDIAVTVAM